MTTNRTASNARKTVEVGLVLDAANAILRKSQDDAVSARHGVAALLEIVLMETGNYNGFAFTDGNNGRTDESRRQYYRASNLNAQVVK